MKLCYFQNVNILIPSLFYLICFYCVSSCIFYFMFLSSVYLLFLLYTINRIVFCKHIESTLLMNLALLQNLTVNFKLQ